MESKVLTATKETDADWSPPTKEGEHNSSSNVFFCVPPLLKFVAGITLNSFPFSCTEVFSYRKKKHFVKNSTRRTMITETSFNKHIMTSSLTFNHLKCIRNLQLWFASGLKVMLIDAHPLKRGSIAVLQLFSSLFQLFFNFFVGYLRLQRVICRLNSPHPATINYTSYFN